MIVWNVATISLATMSLDRLLVKRSNRSNKFKKVLGGTYIRNYTPIIIGLCRIEA